MAKFAVAHVSKLKSGGIGSHIDRKHEVKNADPDRKHLNHEFIKTGNTLYKDVKLRIQEGYKSDRKIRPDAVKAVGVILTGSNAQMKEIEKRGEMEDWVKENFKFAQDKFGSENLVRFTLHMDERTPHIHCVFTPIDENGKLRYKSFFDGKKDLTKFQDDYARQMEKFGLERGLRNSRAKHTTTREYYKLINSAAEDFEVEKNILGITKAEATTEKAQKHIAIQAELAMNATKEKEKSERKRKQTETQLNSMKKTSIGMVETNKFLKGRLAELRESEDMAYSALKAIGSKDEKLKNEGHKLLNYWYNEKKEEKAKKQKFELRQNQGTGAHIDLDEKKEKKQSRGFGRGIS